MRQRLARLVQVRPGEWGLVALALVFAFATVAETALIRIYADAVLLTAFDAGLLPVFIIGTSVAFMAVSLAYASALGRVAAVSLNGIMLGASALLTIGLYPLASVLGKPIVFATCLVLNVAAPLVRIVCWNAITECLDARQSKRLLPLAGAGSTVGAILAGVLAGPFVRAFGTDALLLVIGGLFALTAPMPRLLAARALSVPQALRAKPTMEATKEGYMRALARGFSSLRTHRLIFTVAAMLFLSSLVNALLDYTFKTTLQARFARDDMAVFLGHFQALVNTLILFFQLFVVGRVMTRYTVRFLFGLLPVTLLAGAAVMTIDPVFFVVVGMAFFDQLLRYTFQNSVTEMVLSPVAVLERNRAKVVIKGVVVPIGGLVAGLLLLPMPMLASDADVGVRIVGAVVLACLVAWLYRVVRVRRFYMEELKHALGFGRIVLTATPEVRAIMEGDALREVLARIERSDAALADFYAEVLARDAVSLMDAQGLLDHENPRVRVAVLGAIAAGHLTRQRKRVIELLERESHPDVLRAGLRSLAALGNEDLPPIVRKLSEHPMDDVRAEALVLLFHAGERDDRARARRQAEGWIKGGPRARASAAYLIGELCHDLVVADGAGPLDEPLPAVAAAAALNRTERGPSPWDVAALGELLSDREQNVREAAYRAVARARLEVYVPRLVQALPSRLEAPAALAALAELGPHATGAVVRAFRSRAAPRRLRLAIVSALGRLPVSASVLALLELLRDGDCEVRRLALRSLQRLRPKVSPRAFVRARLVEALQREVRLTHLYAGLALEATRNKMAPLFIDEVERRFRGAREAIFALLALLYDDQTLRALRRRYRIDLAVVRANTLELIENLVDPDLRLLVARALEDVTPELRDARARAAWTMSPQASFATTLLEATDDRWLQRCLFYVSGPELGRRFPTREREVQQMVPLMERVILLKSVPLFAELSGETLYPIAEIAEDVDAPAGTVIFERGDVGTYLYVIARGEVEIERDGVVVRKLSQADAFGEMALLDEKPRSASAIARTDVSLLRIESEPFGDLLDQHPEIARGIIRVLLGYVRADQATR